MNHPGIVAGRTDRGPRRQHHRHGYARDRVRQAPVYVMVLELPPTGTGGPIHSPLDALKPLCWAWISRSARSDSVTSTSIGDPSGSVPSPRHTDSAASAVLLPSDAGIGRRKTCTLIPLPRPGGRWRAADHGHALPVIVGDVSRKKAKRGHGPDRDGQPVILVLEGLEDSAGRLLPSSVPDYTATCPGGMEQAVVEGLALIGRRVVTTSRIRGLARSSTGWTI